MSTIREKKAKAVTDYHLICSIVIPVCGGQKLVSTNVQPSVLSLSQLITFLKNYFHQSKQKVRGCTIKVEHLARVISPQSSGGLSKASGQGTGHRGQGTAHGLIMSVLRQAVVTINSRIYFDEF